MRKDKKVTTIEQTDCRIPLFQNLQLASYRCVQSQCNAAHAAQNIEQYLEPTFTFASLP